VSRPTQPDAAGEVEIVSKPMVKRMRICLSFLRTSVPDANMAPWFAAAHAPLPARAPWGSRREQIERGGAAAHRLRLPSPRRTI